MNAATADRRMIETGAGRLAARSLGEGVQTLILWPSILADHRIHLGIAHRLAGVAKLVLIDGPGHGDSGPTPGTPDMSRYAAAMAEVMDVMRIDRAVVGGTSWGGLVGAELALTRPDRVAGLVLMNTPLFIDGARPGLRARMIALGARHMLGMRSFRDGVARSFFAPQTLVRDPELAAGFQDMLRSADAAALSSAVRAVILDGQPLAERLDRITVPVLMIAGRDDSLYPLEGFQRAAARLRNGRLVVVPGRHISAADAPEDVSKALIDFLASL
jgi:pimeloyl-ACP methyl ester carboxylesterase